MVEQLWNSASMNYLQSQSRVDNYRSHDNMELKKGDLTKNNQRTKLD